jgi:hypothetical protein
MGFLKTKSITARTRDNYVRLATRLTEHAAEQGLELETCEGVDAAAASFFDVLYFEGAGPYEGRQALWGYAYCHDFAVSKREYPQSFRALKGWSKAAPEWERLPMPWPALLLVAWSLATAVLPQWLAGLGAEVAIALLVMWDAYARPSEVLDLLAGDVLPARRKPLEHSIYLGLRPPPTAREGSAADVGDDYETRPTKTGTYDATVECNDFVSRSAGRRFVYELLLQLRSRTVAAGGARLFDFTLNFLERALGWASRQAGLGSLALTPHMARHGGPSHDYAQRVRSIVEIQERGRWESGRSVARYKRTAGLRRQEAKMTDEQLNAAERDTLQLQQLLGSLLSQPR